MMGAPGARPPLDMERPLQLGASMQSESHSSAFFTCRSDFEPESLSRATQADLLLFGGGEAQEQVKIIPDTAAGDAPFHLEGVVELLQNQEADTECAAVFDGSSWTLELVTGHLRVKHRPGVPNIVGYNVEPSDVVPPSQGFRDSNDAAAPSPQHNEPDIDQELNDALDEALFVSAAGTANDVDDVGGSCPCPAVPRTAVPGGTSPQPALQPWQSASAAAAGLDVVVLRRSAAPSPEQLPPPAAAAASTPQQVDEAAAGTSAVNHDDEDDIDAADAVWDLAAVDGCQQQAHVRSAASPAATSRGADGKQQPSPRGTCAAANTVGAVRAAAGDDDDEEDDGDGDDAAVSGEDSDGMGIDWGMA